MSSCSTRRRPGWTRATSPSLPLALRNIRSLGITAVLVEHNLPLVLEVADVIHVLHMGSVIASGPPDVIRDDPDVAESYLGKRPADRTTEGTTS